jgi:hypothetical protein
VYELRAFEDYSIRSRIGLLSVRAFGSQPAVSEVSETSRPELHRLEPIRADGLLSTLQCAAGGGAMQADLRALWLLHELRGLLLGRGRGIDGQPELVSGLRLH